MLDSTYGNHFIEALFNELSDGSVINTRDLINALNVFKKQRNPY